MNFDTFDRYPDLKQAVEDCYEAQDEQTSWIVRNHPLVGPSQIAVETLYFLLSRLLWLGEPDFAENAVVRMDEGRRERMRALSLAVAQKGITAVPEMVLARDEALSWGPLPGVLAEDIFDLVETRLTSGDEESRLVRLHNEAVAAAARLEDLLSENVVLYVLGAAQTRYRLGRRSASRTL
ncbi:hypothetical protein [Sphingomonas sp. 3-13AW]|uniref:hypothetical protein n=1 Tax=Sphingomonas sp. 3-13AW TaxID=3050450 RepID=UPI003BB784DF